MAAHPPAAPEPTMMQSYWLVPDEVVILQLPSMNCAQQCGKGVGWNSIPRLYQMHASQDSMSFLKIRRPSSKRDAVFRVFRNFRARTRSSASLPLNIFAAFG